MQSKKEASTQYIKSVTYHGNHYRYVHLLIYCTIYLRSDSEYVYISISMFTYINDNSTKHKKANKIHHKAPNFKRLPPNPHPHPRKHHETAPLCGPRIPHPTRTPKRPPSWQVDNRWTGNPPTRPWALWDVLFLLVGNQKAELR